MLQDLSAGRGMNSMRVDLVDLQRHWRHSEMVWLVIDSMRSGPTEVQPGLESAWRDSEERIGMRKRNCLG